MHGRMTRGLVLPLAVIATGEWRGCWTQAARCRDAAAGRWAQAQARACCSAAQKRGGFLGPFLDWQFPANPVQPVAGAGGEGCLSISAILRKSKRALPASLLVCCC